MKRVVEGLDEIRADSRKVTLEIRDLNLLATEEEVKVELRKPLRNDQLNLEVKVLNLNRRGLKLAVVVPATAFDAHSRRVEEREV